MKRSASSLSTTNKRDLVVFILILAVVSVASVLAVTWQAGSAETARALAERARKVAGEQLALERTAREAAERAVEDLPEQLARAQSVRETLEQSLKHTREQLDAERAAREAGERAIKDLRQQLVQARSEKEAVQRSVNDQGGQLGQERSAREAAEAAVRETREQLIQERTAREAAERSLKDRRVRLAQERRDSEAGERAKDLRGGHRGLNDLGPLVDLGTALLFRSALLRSLIRPSLQARHVGSLAAGPRSRGHAAKPITRRISGICYQASLVRTLRAPQGAASTKVVHGPSGCNVEKGVCARR